MRVLRSRAFGLVAQVLTLVLVVGVFVLPRLRAAVGNGGLAAISGFGWPLAAAGAQVGSLLAYSLVTLGVLARRLSRPPFRRLVAIDLSSIVVTNWVPAGGAAGTGVAIRLLGRSGVRAADATSAKLLQGLVGAVSLVGLTAGAVVVLLRGPGLRASDLSALKVGGPVLAAVVALALVLAVLVRLRSGRRWLVRLPQRLPARARPAAGRAAEAAIRSVRLLTADPAVALPTLAAATANWLLDAFSLWCCVHAFGTPPPAAGLLLSFGLATAVGWLPLTPGGIGVVEAVLIPGLIGLGGSSSAAALGVLLWRLVHSWLPVPLSALAQVGTADRLSGARSRLRRVLTGRPARTPPRDR